jgi:hypothetical protein
VNFLNRKLLRRLALAALLFGITTSSLAQGLSDPAITKGNGNPGIKIAPTKYEESVRPGQPKDGLVDVFNVSKQPLTIASTVENIRMVGENGDLDFYTGDNPYRLNSFVQFDKAPFVLQPGEARRVKFRINVPVGVFPGGYFGAILFQIVPPEASGTDTTILQSGRAGVLLIMTVEGESSQKGKIDRFQVSGGSFGDAHKFSSLYANTGNTEQPPLGIAFRPTGKLILKDSLGLTVATKKVNGENVFPGAKRRLTTSIKKPLWFGHYTAELQLSPGPGQPIDHKRVSFWAISPLGILLALLILGALGGLLFGRKRRGRRQDRPQRTSLLDEVAAEDRPGPKPPRA